jgi:hypothetical protein
LIYAGARDAEIVVSPLVAALVLTGAPALFLAIRLVMSLTEYRYGRDVPLMPTEPRQLPFVLDLGIVLIELNMVITFLAACFAVDQLLFDGQVGASISNLEW